MLRALLTLPLLLILALLVSLLVFPGKVGELFSSNPETTPATAPAPPAVPQATSQPAPVPQAPGAAVQTHGPKSIRPPAGNKK